MDSDTCVRLQLPCAKHLWCEVLPACVVRAFAPCLHPTVFPSRKAKPEQQGIPHFFPPSPLSPCQKETISSQMLYISSFAEGPRAGCPWTGPCPASSSSPPADSSHITEWVSLHFQLLFSWSVVLLRGLLACFQLPPLRFSFFIMQACTGQPDAQQGDTEGRAAQLMYYEHCYST